MRFLNNIVVGTLAVCSAVLATTAPSTHGIEALIKRRLPQHAHAFEFSIAGESDSLGSSNDSYTVSNTNHGKIKVEGSSISAVLSGLHKYFADVAHVDIWWFIGNRLDQAPKTLPKLSKPLKGSSVVPYRYYFNTVTTSYTSAFWTWEDWELELDWMALRGINLPLAWIGIEKIFVQVFQEVGLTDEEIHSFLSGPAFLAWNHFGNIQGSWGGDLPFAWVDDQFELQLKIVKRMIELGMTPILPAFPGFVPRAISRVWPEATLLNSSNWEGFDEKYTNDTYLDPFDPHFAQLQKSFITKQKEAYGNITNFWTLDQFNENEPASFDLDYLHSVSENTWKTLKAADAEAVWVMQGWLFVHAEDWTNERIEAFLGGVPVNSDMLILDLFAESVPQWVRTKSFYGKPWIWCELHDYGGNMGLYGQIENLTVSPIEALRNSSSLVGFGLAPEAQEGNEIVYDLLLDQAWSPTPIDTETYFHNWVTTRYEGSRSSIPKELYSAWEIGRPTVFNNTNLTINAVPKSILELVPSYSGLQGRVGRHGTTNAYAPGVMVKAWRQMYKAGLHNPLLFSNPAYHYDLVDWTRQVLVNAFEPLYHDLIVTYNSTKDGSKAHRQAANRKIHRYGTQITDLLSGLDAVLATDKNFRVSTWIDAARRSAPNKKTANFFEYNARNQITLWGPKGEIRDYASKQWAGLVGEYYLPRWQRFVDYLLETEPSHYNQTVFRTQLLKFEESWGDRTSKPGTRYSSKTTDNIKTVIGKIVKQFNEVFEG